MRGGGRLRPITNLTLAYSDLKEAETFHGM